MEVKTLKQYRNKIISGAVIIAILAFAFWYGSNTPGFRGTENQPESGTSVSETVESVSIPEKTKETAENPSTAKSDKAEAEENKPVSPITVEESQTKNEMVIDESTGKDKYLTDPVPEGKPIPVEPENAVVTGNELTCTLSVRCDTILNNMEWLDKEKINIVPENGVIFEESTVAFYEGESVFDLLLREMKQNKIHMEFENTPIYNSAYIEGIANLYEFDCGELSGWMYKVNGWFPNYGCSRYQLKDGDKVEWVYTCDLGRDVGGYYSAKGN